MAMSSEHHIIPVSRIPVSRIPVSRPAATGSGHTFGGLVVAMFDAVFAWLERRRQRDMLSAMSDHLLQDIGVTRAEALREAGKPFWRE